MAKLAQLPANDRASDPDDAEFRRTPRLRTRYYAFLSYSHKDHDVADWLHRELERFRVPHSLAGRHNQNGVVPKRLTPIFRDRHELAAADDLGAEIRSALASSQYLIVLCSPDAAKSRWTNAEIEEFKRTRPEGCVLAAIVSGEPYASDVAGRAGDECFPPALRERYDRLGRPTGKRAEPLAADLRESGDGPRLGFLKLVAGMLGVGLDELVQRETTRRHRRLAWLAAGSLTGMAVTSTLALAALQARDTAREQRREAEGLVGFMIGDLKDKLEPIGKLDVLDGVGSRVLAYYRRQSTADISDAALVQRSRALSLLGQVANLRGNLNAAAGYYREAMAGTAEAIRRNPNDPQHLYDHAQNIFWMGDIARQRGDFETVESDYREYKRLAQRMVTLDPSNSKWRMEEQDADANLGIAFWNERRFSEAASQFDEALQAIQPLATADSSNDDYRASLAETLAWAADAKMAIGQLDLAIVLRQQQVELLTKVLNRGGADVQYRQILLVAQQALGRLYAMTGQRDLALSHLRAAVGAAGQLGQIEPSNAVWRQLGLQAQLALADYALAVRNRDEAIGQANSACDTVRRLLGRDGSVPSWRAGLANCEMVQAKIALTGGAKDEAAAHATSALAAAKAVKSNDTAENRYRIAKAYRLIGDVARETGDDPTANAAWSKALAALPAGIAEKPAEMDEHATILQRLGRGSEARHIVGRLNEMGYRRLT